MKIVKDSDIKVAGVGKDGDVHVGAVSIVVLF